MSSQAHVSEQASGSKIPGPPHNHDYDVKMRESFEASNDRSSPMSNYHGEANTFTRYRTILLEYAGEFFGTMLICIFGIGANCQAVLSNNPLVSGFPAGNWTSLSLGWATGVAFGAWISGGHINPAVTLALAVWRGFPWKKVPLYILAQLLGALVGAAIVYGNYFHAIDAFEGVGVRTMKTAGLFGTLPAPFMTNGSAFFSEFLCTAMLTLGILTLTDKKNNLPSSYVPIGLFIIIYGISACLGFETSFALNPARDLGPRVLSAMVGYGGQVFSMRSQYWLWCPIIATSLGAQVATCIYDLLFYTGTDSLIFKKLGPNRSENAKSASGSAAMV